MEKINEKIKSIMKKKEIYIFLGIMILFFGIFSFVQYAPDTYSVFANELNQSVIHFFSCGRYITGIFTFLIKGIFKFKNETFYYISYGIAIVSTIIAMYKLNKMVEENVKNKYISKLISIITIVNPFTIELFMYIEKGIMMFSVLASVIAVEKMKDYFEGNKKSIFWALVWMFIANCSYQGTVGVFVALSLILILKYSKDIKSFIKNNIIIALTYAIPAILNLVTIKIFFNNTRMNGKMVLSKTIEKVILGTKTMLVDSYNILPKYFLLFIIVLLIGYCIYKIFSNKNKKEKGISFLSLVYLIAGIYLSSVAPQFMQGSESIWFVARSSYPMATIIGIIIMYICMNFDIKDIEKKLISILVMIFLAIQLVNFQRIEIDNYIGNYEDKRIAIEINNEIVEYENKTNNKIDTLKIYQDKEKQYVYPGLRASGDMNIRAFTPNWCVSKILKLYTGRDFKVEPANENIEKEFEKENWNYYVKDQIKFENNIMHLCIY